MKEYQKFDEAQTKGKKLYKVCKQSVQYTFAKSFIQLPPWENEKEQVSNKAYERTLINDDLIKKIIELEMILNRKDVESVCGYDKVGVKQD